MTNRKLSELTELTSADNADLLHILDTSETSLINKNKKITVQNLIGGLQTSTSSSPLTTKGDLVTYDTNEQRLAIGNDGQVLSVNSSTATGLEWVNLEDESYININHSGAVPIAGTGNMAIGEGASADGINSIAIGNNANSVDQFFSFSNIAVGANATALGDNSITIGADASNESAFGIAIGDGVTLEGANSIAIGSQLTIGVNGSPALRAVAIGGNIGPSANNAVQIGVGTNNTENSFQYLSTTIANSEGIQAPTFTTTPTSNPVDGSLAIDNANDTLYFRSGSNWLQAGGEPYVEINSTETLPINNDSDSVVIGPSSSSQDGFDNLTLGKNNVVHDPSGLAGFGSFENAIIGFSNNTNGCFYSYTYGSFANNDYANSFINTGFNNSIQGDPNTNTEASDVVAIGSSLNADGRAGKLAQRVVMLGSSSTVSGVNGVSIGHNADITANNAIQLGTGSNTTDGSLQYRTNIIANAFGLQSVTSSGAPTSLAPDGSLSVDTLNQTLYVRSNNAWFDVSSHSYQTTGTIPTSTPADGTLVIDNNGGVTTLYARANGAWITLISV